MGDDGNEQPASLGRRALIRGTATAIATGGVATTAGANGEPTAAFRVDPSEPDPGESVTLDATVSQADGTIITEYEWDIESRLRPATGREVSHTWRDPGLYAVTLTVTDGDGRSDTTQEYVEVFNQLPTAAFRTGPSDLESGSPVTLDASPSSDPDGTVTEYDWSITDSDGESVSAFGQTTTFTWEDTGTYPVTLTVVDDSDGEQTVTKEIRVGNRAPGAACAVVTETPVQYEPVTVDGSLSVDRDGEVVAYDWAYETSFGTQYASGAEIQHTFQEPGTYRFELTVTDDDGDTDTAATIAEVAPGDEPEGGDGEGTPTESPEQSPTESPSELPEETTESPDDGSTAPPTESPETTATEPTTTTVQETTATEPTTTSEATTTPETTAPASGGSDPEETTALFGGGGGQNGASGDQSGDGGIGLAETLTAGVALAGGALLYHRRSDDDGEGRGTDDGPSSDRDGTSAGGSTPSGVGGRPAGTDGGTTTVPDSKTGANDTPVEGTQVPDPSTAEWSPDDPSNWSNEGSGDTGTAAASTAESAQETTTDTTDADPLFGGEADAPGAGTDVGLSEGVATGSAVAASAGKTASTTEDTSFGSVSSGDVTTETGESEAASSTSEDAGTLGIGPGGAVNPMAGDESVTAAFVDSVPAVESAELVARGPLYKYRGSMTNGPDDVWFWTVDPADVDDADVTAAFENHVETWAALDDGRYVATVADYGTDPRPWVAVLAAETTVGSMDHSLPREQVRAVIDGVTKAMQTAAEAGVDHYTLAPEHVHVVADGQPAAVVSDWGLEAAVAAAAGREQEPTPYDAPEQVYDDEPIEETAVYRLAAVSYHALTAAEPAEAYQFDPDYDLERTIIDRQYTPVTRHDSTLSPAIDAVLKQAMEPNPSGRHGSKERFRKSLRGSL